MFVSYFCYLLKRYVLYAEAANQVSKVYSNKIVVSVLEKITEVRMKELWIVRSVHI